MPKRAAALIGVVAIVSIATLVENDPKGVFATLNGLAWFAYFLWIAAVSIGLLRAPFVRPDQESRTANGSTL